MNEETAENVDVEAVKLDVQITWDDDKENTIYREVTGSSMDGNLMMLYWQNSPNGAVIINLDKTKLVQIWDPALDN